MVKIDIQKWVDCKIIEDWFTDQYYEIKDKIRGVKNIIRWIPTLYKDRDWDDSFIFTILQFKLKNQADYIESQERFVGYEQAVRHMRICVNLIEKVKDEFYDMEPMDYYDSEFSFEPSEYEGLSSLKIEYGEDKTQDYINKYRNDYKRMMIADPNTSLRYVDWVPRTQAMALGRYRQTKAQKLLFKIIDNHINEWWD